MTEIQQNRWDRLVRRAAGVVGGGSQVNDTLNELFPVIDVENVPGELLALMQTTLGTCSSELLAGGATLRNHHQLFNPAGSSMLFTVTTVAFFSSAASDFRFSNFIGALATLAGNERRRDTRAGTLAQIAGQQRTDQSTVSGGLDFRLRSISSNSEILHDPNGIAVLFPGTGLTITCQTLDIDSTVSFMWRERVFEPSEEVG